MRWKETPQKKPITSQGMGYIVWLMSRLEPIMVSILRSSSVFSLDEKKTLIEDFRGIRERWVDGLSRSNSSKGLTEGTVEFPTSVLFDLDDVSLQVKMEKTEEDLLYFVSLFLTSLERPYLTNHIGESLYRKYKRLLRFLPKFHHDMTSMMEGSRRST